MKNNTAMKNSIISPPVKASIHKQKGLTLISWIVVVVFLLFQGVIAMNVLPVYITDSSIKKIMTNLPDDSKARNISAKELKVLLAKRLSINSIYTVKAEHIKVKTGRGENIAIIEYEPRGKLIGNLDYIVSFKHETKVKSR